MNKIPSLFQRNYDGDRLVRDEAVIAMYREGYSTSEVGLKFDLHSSYVSRILKRHSEPARTTQSRKVASASRRIIDPSIEKMIVEFCADNRNLAYLAGIVDGEGCLLIYRKRDKRNTRHFRCILKVSNTSMRLISWLTSHLGGTFATVTSANLPVYHWAIEGPALKMLLEQLVPHLVIKWEIAHLLIRMQERLLFGSSGVRLSEDERLARETLFHQYVEERIEAKGR